MNDKCLSILKLIGPYPPDFVVDLSPYRNCYGHALNCMFEDRDYSIYSPGAITALFNGSDCFINGDYYFRPDLCITLIKRDASCMGRNAFVCDYSSKLYENAYKIVLTYSKADNDFHFLRQNSDGSWSHKPGYGRPRRLIRSELISYHGESQIEICGRSYKVIEILQLQKRAEK